MVRPRGVEGSWCPPPPGSVELVSAKPPLALMSSGEKRTLYRSCRAIEIVFDGGL